MPYLDQEFYVAYFEKDKETYGYIETRNEADREKWKRQVHRSHGKDTVVTDYEFWRPVYAPPPKEEKAKKEDTA